MKTVKERMDSFLYLLVLLLLSPVEKVSGQKLMQILNSSPLSPMWRFSSRRFCLFLLVANTHQRNAAVQYNKHNNSKQRFSSYYGFIIRYLLLIMIN
jgi:hypothetical protein